MGAGKSAVGRTLAAILPGGAYVDGDDHAGPSYLPPAVGWRRALDALLRLVVRPYPRQVLVVAYPLQGPDYARLRAACGRARRTVVVVTLAPPFTTTLRGRGGRKLDAGERARVREMRSEGYHRRRFAALTLPNVQPPAAHTARLIARRIQSSRKPSGGSLRHVSQCPPFHAAAPHSLQTFAARSLSANRGWGCTCDGRSC